jgi:iron complex outermembrane receptor protein
MFKRTLLLVKILLCLSVGNVVGEEVEQVVISATPAIPEGFKKSFSVVSYTEEAAGPLNSDRLEDVLVAAGVQPSNQNAGMETSFFVRGYRTDNGNIFINGHQDHRRFYTRDLETVERVDLIKGHSSVLFGSGSPGGSIVYATKSPKKDAFTDMKLSIGSYDHKRMSLDSTGAIGNTDLSYRAVLVGQDAKSFMRNVSNDKSVALLNLLWSYSSAGNLRFETESTKLENPYNFGTVRVNGKVLYDQSYVDPRATSERDYRRNSLYWEHVLNDQWHISGLLSYATMDRQDMMMGFYYKRSETSLLGYWADANNDFWQGNSKFELRGTVQAGTIEHQITVGLEYDKLNNHLDRMVSTAFTLDPINPSFDRPIPRASAKPRNFHYRDDDRHAYLMDSITLAEDINVSVGLRASDFRNDNLLSGQIDAEQDTLASLLGLSWQASKSLEFYGNNTKSYEPNSGVDKEGNFFEPREATQIEVGMRFTPLPTLSLQLAAYDLTQSNLLTADPLDRDYQIPTGARQTRGIELESEWGITQTLQLRASYSHLSNKVVEDFQGLLGKTASGISKNMGSVRVNWAPNSVYSASLGIIGTGHRYGDSTNSFVLPGYARVDAGLLYRHQALTFRLTIENLTNERYIAAPFAEDDLYQGKLRDVIAGVSYRW